MAYKALNQQILIKHVLNGQNLQDKGVQDRPSEQQNLCSKINILMICIVLAVLVPVRFRRLFCTDCCRHAGCPLSWSREVSASQKFQMYYFYKKSNRGHGFCPLYRGCPPFRESVIRGSLYWMQTSFIAQKSELSLS